ncbi:MAG: hypothetical protein V4710_22775 [Verrucomicrobiota bacterium]
MKLLPIYVGSGLALAPVGVWITLLFLDFGTGLLTTIGLLWSLPSVLIPGYNFRSLHSILGYMPPSYPAAAFCFVFWFACGFGICFLAQTLMKKRTRQSSELL